MDLRLRLGLGPIVSFKSFFLKCTAYRGEGECNQLLRISPANYLPAGISFHLRPSDSKRRELYSLVNKVKAPQPCDDRVVWFRGPSNGVHCRPHGMIKKWGNRQTL